MYSMSFTEFLLADGSNDLVNYMESLSSIEDIPEIFFNKLSDKLKIYYIIGGMPEAVNSWINYKDINKLEYIQQSILSAYENDFSKHTSAFEANKISIIFNSIPSQLSRDNKKFLYGTAKEGARAREYEDAINWLANANILNKVYNISKPNMPLISYNDLSSFKIYLHDVGLLKKMTDLDSSIITEGNRLYEEFKGALTENYILQTLKQNGFKPNYFTFNNRYEIDFIIQYKNKIIPIEVKSGNSVNSTSLSVYNNTYNPDIRIKYSMNNLSKDDNLINIPLFLAEYTQKFINLI